MFLIPKINFNFTNIVRSINKNAPTIGIIAGCGGTVVGAVLIAKQSSKVEAVKRSADNQLSYLEKTKETYAVEEFHEEVSFIYRRMTFEIFKLYLPAIIVIISSILSIGVSGKVLTARLARTSAALAALSSLFDRYRSGVIEEYGEEVDNKLLLGQPISEDSDTKTSAVSIPEVGNIPYILKIRKSDSIWRSGGFDYIKEVVAIQQHIANLDLFSSAGGIYTLNQARGLFCKRALKPGMVFGWIVSRKDEYDKHNPLIRFDVIEQGYEADEYGRSDPYVIVKLNCQGNIYEEL